MMKLIARLQKLELLSKHQPDNDTIDEAEYQAFEDWVLRDPQAKVLLARKDRYCVEKGYPPNDIDFFDTLEDPVFWQMVQETVEAFHKYRQASIAIDHGSES